MRKICLALLLLPCLLVAEVDERKSDVYFANGIDTKQDDAEKSAYVLRDETELDYPKSYQSIANWKVSYNKTKGFQQDIYESAVQKIFTKLDESHSLSQYSGALV